jgi:hypothetical protein
LLSLSGQLRSTVTVIDRGRGITIRKSIAVGDGRKGLTLALALLK